MTTERSLQSPTFVYVAAFVLTGMATTLLGPILPDLLVRWRMSDAAAGALFTAQFSGGVAGGAVSGALVARCGDTATLGLGYGTMAVGLLAFLAGSYSVGIGGAFVAGLGIGFVVPATNLLVARRQPERAASALGALNLAWGLGAAVWPLVVSAIARVSSTTAAVLLLGVLAASTAAMILRTPNAAIPGSEGDGPHRRISPAFVVLLGTTVFLYSGIEMAVGGWLPEYARRVTGAAAGPWAAVGTAFWGGLSAGRGAIAVRLDRRYENAALFAGLLVAAAGVALLIRTGSSAAVPALAAITGFGLGPVFPITAALVSRDMPTHIAGPLLSLGSLGSATVPWLVGFVSDRARSLATGFVSVMLLLGVLIALHVVRTRTAARRA